MLSLTVPLSGLRLAQSYFQMITSQDFLGVIQQFEYKLQFSSIKEIMQRLAELPKAINSARVN